MANDPEQEAEALEWCEGLVDDAVPKGEIAEGDFSK
jgi:hypothetical protein